MDPRIAKALELLRNGKAPTYTAKCIGVNQNTLSRMFREAGLPCPKDIWFESLVDRVDPNMSTCANAKRLNVDRKTIRKALKLKEDKQCSR